MLYKLRRIGDILLPIAGVSIISASLWMWATPWLHG